MAFDSRIAPARLAIGMLLLTLGSLLTELSLTRVFSVLMWYHLAFLAISLGLVGLSAGAVSVYAFPSLAGRAVAGRALAASRLTIFSLLAGTSTAVALLLMLRVRLTEQVDLAMFLRIALVCLVGAVPFFFIGVATSLAIREAGTKVSVVYAADLFGAATGCLLFVPLVDALGAPLTIFAGGVACAAAAAVFAATLPARARFGTAAAVVLLAAIGVALDRTGLLNITYAKGQERRDLVVRWNAFSRVAVWERPTEKSFTAGISSTYRKPITVEKLVLDIDAGANTPILQAPQTPADLDFLSHDLTSLPFTLVQPRETLVIGPGGGRDVVLALKEGSERVTAVEINPAIVDLVRGRFGEYSGGLYSRPDVRVVVRDGRSFVQSDPGRYDLIMLSLVDTFAASAAGAMSLTENLLYTQEAFDAYFDRLTPTGVMAFTRWIWEPERETLRIVALARASLARAGVAEPHRHILVASQNNLGCVMISRSPLTDAQLDRARTKIAAMGFQVLHDPGRPGDGPIARLATTADPAAFYAGYPFDVRPPTDNRPFFFFTLRPADVFRVLSMPAGRAQNLGVLIVVTVGVVVTAMAAVFVFVPLLLRRRAERREATLAAADQPRVPVAAFVLYFMGLGAAFMLVEIPVMQGFTLFLGQPSASLSVVLFAILAGGGIGSFWTRTWPQEAATLRRRLATAAIAAAVTLAVLLWAAHAWLPALAGWPQAAKVALTAAMVAPLGICLGVFFPTGLRWVSARSERLVPWAVGLNAVASVLGSVLSLAIAITAGLWQAAAAGLFVYGVVLVVFVVLTRDRPVNPPATA